MNANIQFLKNKKQQRITTRATRRQRGNASEEKNVFFPLKQKNILKTRFLFFLKKKYLLFLIHEL